MFRRFVRALIPALIGALLLSACAAPGTTAPAEPEPAAQTEETEATETMQTTEATEATEATETLVRRVLCVGDSNTYGYDPRDGGRYELEQRWPGRLVRDEREVINQGVNGATVPYGILLDSVREEIEQAMPVDLVIVMLGTNDLLRGYEPTDCVDGMERLISVIREITPDSEILLICPPATPLGDEETRSLLRERYAELEQQYRALTERLSVHYADANGWGIELGGDELHFSLEGHAVFASEVDALISQIFAESEKNS